VTALENVLGEEKLAVHHCISILLVLSETTHASSSWRRQRCRERVMMGLDIRLSRYCDYRSILTMSSLLCFDFGQILKVGNRHYVVGDEQYSSFTEGH
jgi:hypothetical protein